jgi:hypothetical protein
VFKKFGISVALAFALVGGGIAATASAPATATASVAVSHAAPVQLASIAAPMSVDATQLSAAQMSDVQGDGLWKKFKKWVKKVVKKVIGVIVQEIIKAITEWLEELFSSVTGGEKQEGSENEVKNYNSQADYEADNAASTYVENNDFQQTETWYGAGDGGGCSGGGYEQENTYQQYQMIQPSC